MEAVAPGFTDSMLHRQVIGPHQMQDEYGLVGGNIFHGELTPGPDVPRPPGGRLRRPAHPDHAACTRPGSATHGGGGVTGIPGRNVVRQILADRRADRLRGQASPAAGTGRGPRVCRPPRQPLTALMP